MGVGESTRIEDAKNYSGKVAFLGLVERWICPWLRQREYIFSEERVPPSNNTSSCPHFRSSLRGDGPYTLMYCSQKGVLIMLIYKRLSTSFLNWSLKFLNVILFTMDSDRTRIQGSRSEKSHKKDLVGDVSYHWLDLNVAVINLSVSERVRIPVRSRNSLDVAVVPNF